MKKLKNISFVVFFVLLSSATFGWCESDDAKLQDQKRAQALIDQKKLEDDREQQRLIDKQLEERRLDQKRLDNAIQQRRLDDQRWERSHGRL